MPRSIALFGCGRWGKNLARNLHELDELAVIVDAADQAKLVASDFGVDHMPSVGSLLDDPSIKGVAIATPASTHFEIAKMALEAGKGVFVEKPIALSTAEGQQLVALAESRRQVLMVGHLLQYHPIFIRLKQLVDDGTLGNVRYIASSRLNLGTVRAEENVIWSFSPHDISMVLALAGSAPDKVSAIGSFVLPQAIADMGTVHLEWYSGIRADITSSWLLPEKEQKIVVVGDKAMAVFSDTLPWEQKLKIYHNHVNFVDGVPKAVAGEIKAEDVPLGEPLKMEMQHFLSCLDGRDTVRTDGREATNVLAVLKAAEVSMDEENRWVNIDELLSF